VRGRRGLENIGIVFSAPGRAGRRARHIAGIERAQQQPPAARANGRQHTARRVTDQQQQGFFRGLLKHLQQCIGAGAVELIDGIDNGDAPAALTRGRAEETDRLAHVLDRDVLAQIAFVVERAFKH
jgi:hypothetical protein